MNTRIAASAVTAAVIVAAAGTAFAASGSSSGTASDYVPLASTRIIDTRTAGGAVGSDKTLAVHLPASVPATATAVTVELTATDSTTIGFLQAYADGTTRPAQGSNVNYGTNETIANQATIPVQDGKIDVYNFSAGTVQVVVDLEGYYTPTAAAYTPIIPIGQSWTASTSVKDHPDSGNSGGNWAVDTIQRTATITLKSAAPLTDCAYTAGATACYLYDGTISDTGTFTTASSTDITTDGLSPNASRAINGTVEGTITGGTPVEFYASSDAPNATLVPTSVSGVVSGNETTGDWVQQFFPAGTEFANDGGTPELLTWDWSYTAPSTCETWSDGYNGETGDITGVNACAA